jgi:prepilin-type N-terminal cleavage/methylation domain-containing protein
MKTPYQKNKGFTLVEILVTTGILVLILSLGLFVSIDFFRSYSFRTEQNITVSVLQKARSQSMNNINQARHGVRFASPLKYIIFECDNSNPQCTDYGNADTSKDIILDPSYGSTISSPATEFDVIFEQLSGSCVTSNCSTLLTIITNDNGKTHNITVNSEGQIDW